MAKKAKAVSLDLNDIIEKFDGVLQKGSSDIFSYVKIPFGIHPLDRLLGGGIPRKRITLLVGQPNVGKTYLASQVVARVQKAGGKAVWIDAEMSWDARWMAQCGVDIDNIYVAQPVSGEEAFDIIRDVMNVGVDIVVLDSVAGLIPASFRDEDFDYNPIAWQARLVNQSIPRIIPSLKHGTAFVAINQLRASMGRVPMDTMPGGEGQGYFAHFRIEVRRQGWIEEDKNRIGFDMEIFCRKSKVGGEQQRSCVVPFLFSGGFDLLETMLREAMREELIVQSGPWYSIKGVEQKVLGMNGLKDFFLANSEKRKEIEEAVLKNGIT